VRYPHLPEPFDPQPDEWLAALRPELAALEGERTVLCHSLACLLWLLHARAGGEPVDRVLLVAPPCSGDVPAVVRFQPDGVTPEQVRAAAGSTRMVCAPDGDPYCPPGAPNVFGSLVTATDVIDGGGHLNTDAGYGPWPAVEQWAVGEREEIGPS
jgi:predicted alpha/beta hydrolase family esterase